MSIVVSHDYTIDIATPILESTPLTFSFIKDDAKSHLFSFSLLNDGVAVDLSTATASISVNLPSGSPVTIAADITNDVISAALTAACFAEIGRIYIHVRVVDGDQIITVFSRHAQVV